MQIISADTNQTVVGTRCIASALGDLSPVITVEDEEGVGSRAINRGPDAIHLVPTTGASVLADDVRLRLAMEYGGGGGCE